jgi:hypothetical protein
MCTSSLSLQSSEYNRLIIEICRIGLSPCSTHVVGQLWVIRLELGWRLCIQYDCCVDSAAYQAKECAAQDKTDQHASTVRSGQDEKHKSEKTFI